MNIESITSSVIIGLVSSGAVACFFYRLGRIDTESVFRRVVLTTVLMRLKEMTPTSQERVAHGYGLRDTAHWLTCLSEVLREIGFFEDSDCINAVIVEMQQSPHIPEPNDEQRREGEAKKKKWEAKIHSRIAKLK